MKNTILKCFGFRATFTGGLRRLPCSIFTWRNFKFSLWKPGSDFCFSFASQDSHGEERGLFGAEVSASDF
jgi:hypothetical protein